MEREKPEPNSTNALLVTVIHERANRAWNTIDTVDVKAAQLLGFASAAAAILFGLADTRSQLSQDAFVLVALGLAAYLLTAVALLIAYAPRRYHSVPLREFLADSREQSGAEGSMLLAESLLLEIEAVGPVLNRKVALTRIGLFGLIVMVAIGISVHLA